MRTTFLLAPAAALVASAAVVAPAFADHHAEGAAPSLEEVLASDKRGDDGKRDQYRRPAETLAFFGVEPTMTVAEYGPGGGWYTRVLAPYLMPAGQYMAFKFDSDAGEYPTRASELRAKSWTERFKTSVATMMEVEPSAVTAFETDEMPDSVKGTVDRVLIFRSLHGLNIDNDTYDVLKAARMMLKDDGMVGVVQHMAPEGASFDDYDYRTRQRGYMRKEDVVAIFAANGFELAAESDINANPKDPANWENGVWTLPPVLATGENDPKRAEYLSIGESNRMTLLFKKAS